MNKRKLAVMMVIFYLSVGVLWAQKSISQVFNLDILVAANNISPQTTSMLIIYSFIMSNSFSEEYLEITRFDVSSVNWRGVNSGNILSRKAIIIPSGAHTLSGAVIYGPFPNERMNMSITYNFQPGALYELSWGHEGRLTVSDLTNNINYSPEKTQMQAVIQRYTTVTQTPPAQPTARPSTGGGLIGALNRAAQTVMGNLNKEESIAIFGLTTMDRDSALFVQEELEVILVNNRYDIVDRTTLDRIRQEQSFQQQSGEVDENTAVNIGKFAGAKVVITGSITSLDGTRYLRLRALNAETGRVIAAASESL